MSWKLAPALVQLLSQVNSKWTQRSKSSDGTIGDPAHASRKSDHNVDSAGFVRALDITHDPKHGVDSEEIAQGLRASRDPRISYIISNKKICSGVEGPQPWVWRFYGGPNAHNHHVHISVRGAPYRDDAKMWDLTKIGEPSSEAKAAPTPPPLLKLGSKGASVGEIQRILKITADEMFGPQTEKAVKEFQRDHGLLNDGKVGPATWALLKGPLK